MLDRRRALKLLAGGAIATTGVMFMPAGNAIANIRQQGKKRLAMVIDLSRCNGCKACVVSCGIENGTKPDEHRTQVIQTSAEIGNKQYAFNLPIMCNNCEDPSCVSVCPTGATFKREEDGIVVVDSTLCIGCNYCIQACPYSGVRFTNSTTGTVDKCNFCIQRTSKGLLPACVETCTGAARVFGDINDVDSEVSKLLSQSNPMVLQASKQTSPNVFYIGLTQEESNTAFSIHSPQLWQR
jgi:tetrathionate reductase subunit B